MPIEIRELVIKATIADNAQQQPAAAPGNAGGSVDDNTVQKIIDQVLSKMKNANER